LIAAGVLEAAFVRLRRQIREQAGNKPGVSTIDVSVQPVQRPGLRVDTTRREA
jgi:hypothetical protein